MANSMNCVKYVVNFYPNFVERIINLDVFLFLNGDVVIFCATYACTLAPGKCLYG